MYLELATEEDKKIAEHWKDGADGILIYVHRHPLFLVLIYTNSPVADRSILRCCRIVVASLIMVSIQDLQQSPQDTSNFYLANMYQATINPNSSSSLPASPVTLECSRSGLQIQCAKYVTRTTTRVL